MTSGDTIPALCVFEYDAVPCSAAAALAAQRPDIIVGFDMVGEEWMPFGVEQSTYYYIDQYLQLPEVLSSACCCPRCCPCCYTRCYTR